ncbi:family 16 glycosylhydrolase [Paenibacillus elgii]|nr:family 16 glycosylhydrolase [Paenibacillus elgii]
MNQKTNRSFRVVVSALLGLSMLSALIYSVPAPSFAAGPLPAGTNLVKNGGFEQGKADWEDWGAATVVTTDVQSGTKALKLGPTEGGMGQKIDGIDENTIVTLSGAGKAGTPGEKAWIGADCLDASDKKLAGGKFMMSFESAAYEQKSLSFRTVPGTRKVQVYVYKNPDNGKFAYVDDVALKIGGSLPDEDPPVKSVGPLPSPHPPGVFFDDFKNGIDPEKWLIAKQQWGGQDVNGGVLPVNVAVTRDGIVELTANGDLYNGPVRGMNRDGSTRADGKRTGASIVTKYAYASGSYEVKAKIVPKLGAVSAFWTFFNNGEVNHEIDFEAPGDKSLRKIMTTTWVVEARNTSQVTDFPEQIDGNWHVYRFDWHTDPKRVDFYVDNKLIHTSYTNVPRAASKFWLGVWFPKEWAGVPNFATDKMYIDWVKITPFLEKGDVRAGNGETGEIGPGTGWAGLNEYPAPR